jgi:hypothetical protein
LIVIELFFLGQQAMWHNAANVLINFTIYQLVVHFSKQQHLLVQYPQNKYPEQNQFSELRVFISL